MEAGEGALLIHERELGFELYRSREESDGLWRVNAPLSSAEEYLTVAALAVRLLPAEVELCCCDALPAPIDLNTSASVCSIIHRTSTEVRSLARGKIVSICERHSSGIRSIRNLNSCCRPAPLYPTEAMLARAAMRPALPRRAGALNSTLDALSIDYHIIRLSLTQALMQVVISTAQEAPGAAATSTAPCATSPIGALPMASPRRSPLASWVRKHRLSLMHSL